MSGSRKEVRRIRFSLFCAVLMVLSAAVSPLGTAGAASGDASSAAANAVGGSGWPPQAWEDGEFSSLSLVDLALLASGTPPTPEHLGRFERGLAPLSDMPPEHTDVARIVLEGLATSRWHQEQALQDLTPQQRSILASADPDLPTPPGWGEVMAAVDHYELGKALLALESASARSVALLQRLNADPEPTVAGALAEALDLPAPVAGPGLPAAAPAGEATAALVALVSGGLDPLERAALADDLDAMPPQARAAIHAILEGLVPLVGAPTDAGPALVALGAAVDDARDTLRIWSTAAMAAQLHHVQADSGIQIPDANTDKPPLHFGVPRLRDPAAPLPPAPPLAEALRSLATALGDHATARDAETHVAAAEAVLAPGEQAAVAQVLAMTARYIEAHAVVAQVPAPAVLQADPALLGAWAGFLDEGLPAAHSPQASTLLEARPFLAAGLEAALAREDLMTAVQEAVVTLAPQPSQQSGSESPLPAFTAPASHPAAVPCDTGELRIPSNPNQPAYLAMDPCGHTDNTWKEGGTPILLIDVGGDDVYQGRFASAPSLFPRVGTVQAFSPVSILLDLGGSDTYDATGRDCSLGAACGEISGEQTPPVAILVDWQDDGADARNVFLAGDRSQGFASGTGPRNPGGLTDPSHLLRLLHGHGTGLLVERVGEASRLDSEYVAGNRSQGAVGSMAPDVPPGIGALLRLVGNHSQAQGSFRAGDGSQASVQARSDAAYPPAPALAALVNTAGAYARSPDRYEAGRFSQGAVDGEAAGAMALFADIVGTGGRSNDVYDAGDRSRAFGQGAYFLDLLLPDTLDAQRLADPQVELPSAQSPPPIPTQGPTPTPPPSAPNVTAPTGSLAVNVTSTGDLSSSDDVYLGGLPAGYGYILEGTQVDATLPPCDELGALFETVCTPLQENGVPFGGSLETASFGTLFLDISGDDLYPQPGPASNNARWQQSPQFNGDPVTPTGVDSGDFEDRDADLLPYFVENLFDTSDTDPQDPHPTGRKAVVDLGSQHPFLEGPHALAITLTGDTTYGDDFSAAVLLDLAGNDLHLGRTGAAGASLAQKLLSFSLDLEGDDIYESDRVGSQGFGSDGGVGVLLDLGGSDTYRGNASTQGVGVGNGVGVLVDLKHVNSRLQNISESNHFRVWDQDQDKPAQGAGEDGGVGVLVADGDHNSFSDGGGDAPLPDIVPDEEDVPFSQVVGPLPQPIRDTLGSLPQTAPLPPGVSQQGTGVAYNGGNNTPPVITEWTWSGEGGPALAGEPHTFTARADDPDGDWLRYCLTVQTASGDRSECFEVENNTTVTLDHTWDLVPTDARLEGIRDRLVFNATLRVTDPGGLSVHSGDPGSVGDFSINVENPPPALPDDASLRLPAHVRAGQAAAFQLPLFDLEELPDGNVATVDWGDGTPSTETHLLAVDWAGQEWGARAVAPDRYPTQQPAVVDDADRAIDGDGSSFATMKKSVGGAPPTLAVWFEGPRQVAEVSLDASLPAGSQSTDSSILAVEGMRSDGSTLPLEMVKMVRINGAETRIARTWELTDLTDLSGIVVRHIAAIDDENDYTIRVYEVSARGPGATHTWQRPGTYPINYTLLDAFGGRNGVEAPVRVSGGSGDSGDADGNASTRILLHDAAGRGAAKHVSLAVNRTDGYAFTFDTSNASLGKLCVDWGDGSDSDCDDIQSDTEQIRFPPKVWNRSGDFVVRLTHEPGQGTPETWPVLTAHVEEAIDIPGVLFLTYEDDRATWHDGVMAPYQAIVDAGGNDRYLGPVASSLPMGADSLTPGSNLFPAILPAPSLVVDVGGDDTYLSIASRTQAYATHFGVALLADHGGDDVFVAAGEAQAAATRGGVAALLALGGGDAFNPVPADHASVRDASPRADEPWLTRPKTFSVPRPVGVGPDFVQGAAEDGVALLVVVGESALLHAGSRAQGHGAHGPATMQHYYAPGADSGCGEPLSLGPLPGGQPPHIFPNLDDTALRCLLGLEPGYYEPPEDGPLGEVNPEWHQEERLLCTIGGAGPTAGLYGYCAGASPFSPLLEAFLADGPRYGPGTGAVVRGGGPAVYHAASQAQGSAEPAGRGVLLDLDGGAVLAATSHAQAHSVSGTAGAVLGGVSVLRLDAHGQATLEDDPSRYPEANATDSLQAAVLLGPRDARCVDEPTCSSTASSGGQVVVNEADVTPRLPGPHVTVTGPTGPITDDDEITVSSSVAGAVEASVFALTYADWEDDADDPRCTGAPLTASTRVFHGTGEMPINLELNLSALVGDAEPLLPAGCTELHAFVRPAPQDVGGAPVTATEWGHGDLHLLLLPPARGAHVEGGAITTSGEPTEFSITLPEPLALLERPDVNFQVRSGSQVLDTFTPSGSGISWSSQGLSATWVPSSALPQGEHQFHMQVVWPGLTASTAPWTESMGGVLVDYDPPSITIDDPGFARPGHEVTVTGTAEDILGVEAVALRLRDSSGDPVALTRSQPRVSCPDAFDGQGVVCAALETSDPSDVSWAASFTPDQSFLGGTLVVEVNAMDRGGTTTSWQTAVLQVDNAPPRVVSVLTPSGHAASNDEGAVHFLVRLQDPLQQFNCPLPCRGVGVEPGGLVVSTIQTLHGGGMEFYPVQRNDTLPGVDADGTEPVLGFTLHPPDGVVDVVEATYALHILARDRAGNLFDHNPGHAFVVDRADPVLDEPLLALPEMTLPDGTVVSQQALKPGDVVSVEATAHDSILDSLSVFVSGVEGALNSTGDVTSGSPVTLNITLPIDFDPAGGSAVVSVQAVDRAGNPSTATAPPVPFHATPFQPVEVSTQNRSDAVHVHLALDRSLGGPGDGMQAELLDSHGDAFSPPIVASFGGVPGEDARYRAVLPGLQSDTPYGIRVDVWDGANHTLHRVLPARTLPLPAGAGLHIQQDTGKTYSGTVPIPIVVSAGDEDIVGDITLRAHSPLGDPLSFRLSPQGDPVDQASMGLSGGEDKEVTLQWDSRGHVPMGAPATDITLHVLFQTGGITLQDDIILRIDNRGPSAQIRIIGPAAHGLWYNGTVVVEAFAEDDTPPLGYKAIVDNAVEVRANRVTLEEEGIRSIHFTVRDGATPPNQAQLSTSLQIDRTLPTLIVQSGLTSSWTNQTEVGLSVTASDDLSGVAHYRLRLDGGTWSGWKAEPPHNATLVGRGDGEHWVDVEVRDWAHNARRETFSVILDRAPPVLASAHWVGWTQEDPAGAPVLHVVARDGLLANETDRPSGLDAIRWRISPTSAWSDWIPINASDAFPVPGAVDGSVWLQLRDRAGNGGSPLLFEAALPEPRDGPHDTVATEAPSSALLDQQAVSPAEGSPTTDFSFSVRVWPFNGSPPSRVEVAVAGRIFTMDAAGPALEGGARLYSATVNLPPTRLDGPHTFRVTAIFGDVVLEGPERPGPTVFQLGTDGYSDEEGDDASRDAPGPAFMLIILTLATALTLQIRRRT